MSRLSRRIGAPDTALTSTQPSTERRARTTAIAIAAGAQNGTSRERERPITFMPNLGLSCPRSPGSGSRYSEAIHPLFAVVSLD